MDDNPLLWQLLLQLVLILMNAVFACAEIAVITVNNNKLLKLSAAGDRRADRLLSLTGQPAGFLATIQVGITLAGFLGSAFAADNFSDMLISWFVTLGVNLPIPTLDAISVVIITLILSYITLVLGELVPKRIAMKKAEKLALAMSGLIYAISKFFSPLVWILTVSTNGVLRLAGIDPNSKEDEVTEEEIRMMVDAGSEKGTIDEVEKEVIHNIFEFDDKTAKDIMTHRKLVTFLCSDETIDEWKNKMTATDYSFYPVCGENTDDVLGVIGARDFYRMGSDNKEYVMKHALKTAQFVPDTVGADVLFCKMKSSKNYFAVVVDEYGGVSGIVTINDLLQQIVGDFGDV